MRQKLIFFVLINFLFVSFGNKDTWQMDKNHSELIFEVEHLGISEVTGHIKDFSIELESSADDFSDAVIKVVAKPASLDTRVTMRDDHLRSADFFNVDQYPTIEFVSTKVTKKGKNELEVVGNLTMLGITKQVKFELEFNGLATNQMNNKTTAGFKVEGKINRSDFKLGTKFPPPIISEEVEIEINAEFTK